MARPHTQYYVDKVLPSGEVHILAGPSRIGKSALFAQALYDWTCKEQVFGLETFGQDKGKACMVTVDRSINETLDAMERVGVPEGAYKVESIRDTPSAGIDQAFEKAPKDCRILFVEGADAMLNKTTDSREVANFLRYCGTVAQNKRLALILSMGTAKLKSNESYLYAPERISGCAQWGRFCSTVFNVAFEDPGRPNDDVNRLLYISSRNHKGIVRRYTVDSKTGRYVEAADKDTAPAVAMILATTENDKVYSVADLHLLVSGTLQVDQLTIGRAANQLVQSQRFVRDSPGMYKRVGQLLVP